jgi:hypothetical protein
MFACGKLCVLLGVQVSKSRYHLKEDGFTHVLVAAVGIQGGG